MKNAQVFQKINPHTRAILYVILDALGFSLMTFFVRLAGDVPTMQKAFFRNVIAAGIAVIILARTPEKFHIRRDTFKDVLLRCVFGSIGLFMNFWAIDHLSLADANILNKMSPFFSMIMSIFILSEIPTAFETVCIIIAFIGVIFIVKPSAGLASFPAFVGLASGFCAGTAYTFLRRATNHGERGPVIVMCFSAFSCLASVPFLIFDYHPMTGWQWLCLLLAGCAAAVGQLGITAAYSLAPAKEISVFDYSQVLFAELWGFLFFDEIPDALSWIGYAIIIATAVAKWKYNLRKES